MLISNAAWMNKFPVRGMTPEIRQRSHHVILHSDLNVVAFQNVQTFDL